jgi:hypothetical protein
MVVNTIVFMVNHLVNDYEDNYIYIYLYALEVAMLDIKK